MSFDISKWKVPDAWEKVKANKGFGVFPLNESNRF
jgi:hypothetical protein